MTEQDTFWDAQEIPVEIEFDWLNPNNPMVFYMAIQLEGAAKEAQQRYAGLKPAEKKEALQDYYVELISTLATRAPENVPSFPTTENENLCETIRRFFSDGNKIKRLVCVEVIDGYFAKVKRRDFFRGN